MSEDIGFSVSKRLLVGVLKVETIHADPRMTEKHYAHLIPSCVAGTIRAHLPDFGSADNKESGAKNDHVI